MILILLIAAFSIFKSNFDNFKQPVLSKPADDASPVKELAKAVVEQSLQKAEEKTIDKPVAKPVVPNKPKSSEHIQPEKWYIVFDSKKHICAEIPRPKDGVHMHPASLKKKLEGCSNSIYTNPLGKFWSFNCPEQGSLGTSLFTSTKEFCQTLVHLE